MSDKKPKHKTKRIKFGKTSFELEVSGLDAKKALGRNTEIMAFRKDLRKLMAKRMGVSINSLVRVGDNNQGTFVLRSKVKKPIKGVFGNNSLI